MRGVHARLKADHVQMHIMLVHRFIVSITGHGLSLAAWCRNDILQVIIRYKAARHDG